MHVCSLSMQINTSRNKIHNIYNYQWGLLEILEGLLKNIGYEDQSGDDDMTKSLRLLGTWWACKLGHGFCREKATTKLILHLRDPERNP